MKKLIVLSILLMGMVAVAEPAPAPVVEPANVYNFEDVEVAKKYVNEYADNVQNDKNFVEHEKAALATITRLNRSSVLGGRFCRR